jgi:hypothetical protein
MASQNLEFQDSLGRSESDAENLVNVQKKRLAAYYTLMLNTNLYGKDFLKLLLNYFNLGRIYQQTTIIIQQYKTFKTSRR